MAVSASSASTPNAPSRPRHTTALEGPFPPPFHLHEVKAHNEHVHRGTTTPVKKRDGPSAPKGLPDARLSRAGSDLTSPHDHVCSLTVTCGNSRVRLLLSVTPRSHPHCRRSGRRATPDRTLRHTEPPLTQAPGSSPF